MQREWRDPRDGTAWLVTLTPFGTSFERADVHRPPATISFHRPGTLPTWTRYPLDASLAGIGDQELIDLLDAAREERKPVEIRQGRRWPAPRTPPFPRHT